MRNVIEVYVENLKKYNQGILNGRWITLGIAEESLQKILKEHLGIADYNSAIAIFDYHADFEIDEHENIYHLNQTAKLLNCLLDEDCKKVLDYCKVREITAALEISNVCLQLEDIIYGYFSNWDHILTTKHMAEMLQSVLMILEIMDMFTKKILLIQKNIRMKRLMK